MIFIGYEAGTKGYRAYDPVTQRVHITRDAVFDERARWDWSSDVCSSDLWSSSDSPASTFGDDSFTVEHMVLEPLSTPGDGSAGAEPDSPTSPDSTSPTPGVGSESTQIGSPSTPGSATWESSSPPVTGVQFVTPQSRYSAMLDAKDDSNLEHRFHTLQNLLGEGSALELDEELHFLASEEPDSFDETKSDAC